MPDSFGITNKTFKTMGGILNRVSRCQHQMKGFHVLENRVFWVKGTELSVDCWRLWGDNFAAKLVQIQMDI